MEVRVLYRSKSDHARRVEEFIQELERRHDPKIVEVVELDSKEGTELAKLYDIVAYPAVLAVTDDGQLLKLWSGEEVPPLIDEVAGYLQA